MSGASLAVLARSMHIHNTLVSSEGLRLALQILRRLQDAFVITQQRRIAPDVAMTVSVSHKLERS